MRKRFDLKLILCLAVVGISALSSIPLTLARQSLGLKARLQFNAERWERYEQYAWEIGTNAAVAGSLGAFLAFSLIPSHLGADMRRRALIQALKERLNQSEPLTEAQLELIGELLADETEGSHK